MLLTGSTLFRLLDLSFSGTALFKGEKVIATLRRLIGDLNIEDLPVAFTAVASDLDANKEVWLSTGPLFDAIRAFDRFSDCHRRLQLSGAKSGRWWSAQPGSDCPDHA